MKIYYLGRHRPGNWDEGSAITHALRQLGYDVIVIPENEARSFPRVTDTDGLLLYNHWEDTDFLDDMFRMPKIFWYFDLVEWDRDPTLKLRCNSRVSWMHRNTRLADIGFCSDGDWVAKDQTGKLVLLREGVDSRYCGMGVKSLLPYKAVFVGSPNGGVIRRSCIDLLQKDLGKEFCIIGESERNRVWTRELADILASVDVTIAPDSPVTDNYWSNRAYVSLGFGSLLVHPYAKSLVEEFPAGMLFYNSRDQLLSLVHAILDGTISPEDQWEIRRYGLVAVLSSHTFLHRCSKMMSTVKERLL